MRVFLPDACNWNTLKIQLQAKPIFFPKNLKMNHVACSLLLRISLKNLLSRKALNTSSSKVNIIQISQIKFVNLKDRKNFKILGWFNIRENLLNSVH